MRISDWSSDVCSSDLVDAGDAGDRQLLGDHAGMHALLDGAVDALREAEQLDAVAELVGIGDVQRRHVADALDIDRSEIDLAAEGQRGENGKLVRGVDAVDVEAGVRLRVAEPLRLGQHALEVLSGGGRLRGGGPVLVRSEEHTSELQSLMRISYAVFCLNTKKELQNHH